MPFLCWGRLVCRRGSRVTLVAASGGFGIMMADATTRAGLTLPALSQVTKDRIHAVLPLAGTNNPVDASAQMSSRPDILHGILSALLDEPETDATLLFLSLSLYNLRLQGAGSGSSASFNCRVPMLWPGIPCVCFKCAAAPCPHPIRRGG